MKKSGATNLRNAPKVRNANGLTLAMQMIKADF
jgi:hypothetical protein